MHIENFMNAVGSQSLHYDQETTGSIVKDNKDTGKDSILGVYIPRLMYCLDIDNGPYEREISVDKSKLANTKNKNIGDGKLKVKNYLNIGVASIPNVLTPKFKKAENVIVRFVDRDIKNPYILPYQYGNEATKRTKDIVHFWAPNFKNPYEKITFDNTFGLQIDTVDKIMTLYTSKNDGEKGVYTYTIDAKTGKMVMSDSGKRTIGIDTEKDECYMVNEAKSEISMKKGDILIKCKNLTEEVENKIFIKSNTMEENYKKMESKSNTWKGKIDSLDFEGNSWKTKYTVGKDEITNYEGKSSLWKVDSPLSSFTKVLTTDSIHIGAPAGIFPLPIFANFSKAGIGMAGNPAVVSMPAAVAPFTIAALSTVAAVIDALCACLGIPPMCSTVVQSLSPQITSKTMMV